MRNADFIHDQQVFTFINSGLCTTYNDLRMFLYDNKLPIRERWVFYYFGKSNWIDNDEIFNMQNKADDRYGGYIRGEIYYWKTYLSDEAEEKINIENDFIKNGFKPSEVEVHEKFIQEGYEFVGNSIEFDKEWALDQAAYDYQASLDSNDEEEETFCDACQEDPCRCN